MSHRRLLLLGWLLGTLTLAACGRPSASLNTSPYDLIRFGMTEAEVVARLGPPGLITEQPRILVQVPSPTGSEFREKRRATWYYSGPPERPGRRITFENGVVVDTGQKGP